ncbi:TPA: TetR/AcrR family transcriptional regulator, partial [Klebsiella pneumoniae subsp. pneumoniae]|nr:TetR/AcrR family transcriptional regulator [Klebsiella pneumoniae subsp. pneumoniae]
PTKDILGEQVVIQAFSDTQRVFEQIEATEKSAEKRIAAYIDIFAQSHKASLLPLCCALSAETANLPQAITVQTSLYFDMQIEWLTKVVRAGMESGEFSSHAEPSDIALMIINVCEGSSVVAHATARPEVFANSLKYIKLLLNTPHSGE